MEDSGNTRSPPAAAKGGFGRSWAASVGEGVGYFKAWVVGLTKRLTAKTEKDATEAEMQTAKMQVEAANHAEDIKKGHDG